MAGDADLAARLEGLRACEDRALLAGHLVMLTTSDADKAQVRNPMRSALAASMSGHVC